MKIELVTPATRSRKGNWVTAERWIRMLRRLGHRVRVCKDLPERGPGPDLLIALHARKSFASIERFHGRFPDRPLIVTLTGTDLYRDLGTGGEGDAWKALRWADRLILLQPHGRSRLPEELSSKIRVIRQSAETTRSEVPKSVRTFDVCVLGHLRPVKDPFRAAEAARLLPESSRIRIVHAGGALDRAMAARARLEAKENPRYVWRGNLPRWQIRRLLKRSWIMALTSEMEGGANVVSEALVAGTAILSSRISGSVGMLGDAHPGYFEVGDTEHLAELLERCENDPPFLADLEARSRRLAPDYDPAKELETWRRLLAEPIFASRGSTR